jgi:predicted enzyme related to lactoylglutathione lyase
VDGLDLAAIGPGDGPAGWNTYVAVDDADASAAAVAEAGGRVLSGPEDVGPAGRMAGVADPQGARFRLWQARRRIGAQLANVPGAWNFSDLRTPDPATALRFYRAVFGWEADEVPGAGAMVRVPGYGDHLAATSDPGIHERQRHAPPGFADVIGGVVPAAAGESPHWHVAFTVADRDGSAAAAERLGAAVVGTSEDGWTRKARLRDPQGAEFTISQFTPPQGW